MEATPKQSTREDVAAALGGMLLERDVAMAHILAALADARAGSARFVMIGGAAGIGKTRLISAAREEAPGANMRVLHARGSDLERDLAYGVVRQLFGPAVARATKSERAELLSGAAALAAPVFGDYGEREREPDAAGVQYGLYWLGANLAERAPLLMAIDDLQWADEASLRWVAHLVSHLEGLAICVVAARRSGDHGASSLLARLADAADEVVELPALTRSAVGVAVRGALGRGAAAELADACARVTGGNPFYLRELLAEIAERFDSPSSVGSADVSAIGPESIARSVMSRIERLGAATVEFARAIAVLERCDSVHDAAALAAVDDQEAAAIVDELVDARILSSPSPLDFAHAIVRQAVLETIPRATRALWHTRAARLLAARGATDEAALHLVRAGPVGSAWAVEVLERAAAAASERGVPKLAVRYLQRALAELEPEAHPAQLLAALGVAELQMLDQAGVAHLEQAIARVDNPVIAARLALPLARFLTIRWRHAEAVDVLDRALGKLGARDPELALTLERELITTATADVRTAGVAAERFAAAASSPARLADDPVLGAIEGFLTASLPDARAQSIAAARRALAGGRLVESGAPAIAYATLALIFCDELDGAEAAWTAALERARSTGSMLEAAFACGYLAICANRRGAYGRAAAEATTALDALAAAGLPSGPFPAAPLAAALLARGELEAGWALVTDRLDPRAEMSTAFPFVLHERGCIQLARGDHESALQDLLDCGRRLTGAGALNPSVAPWRSVAARCEARAGQRAEAAELLTEELELARAFGAPRALGVARIAAAELAEDVEVAITLARQALAVLEPSPARGTYAEAQIVLGERLTAAGRQHDARDPLRLALDAAHRLGAIVLAQRAHAGLVAAGARPRRPALTGPEALTPSEERAARLAAEGRTSREIAEALFVTVRTVEMHLSRVYRKLGVRGRAELAAALEPPVP